MEKRISNLESKLDDMDTQVSTQQNEITDLKSAVEFNSKDIQSLKKRLVNQSDAASHDTSKLKDKIDDLENRSRRNNLIFHGIPEGSEEGHSCEEFLSDFLATHMKIDDGGDIELERAHRTPSQPQSRPGGTNSRPTRPRPIHCKFLRYNDRQYILKNAAKLLRNNKYRGSSVYISDDVTRTIRDGRKQLRENQLQSIRQDERVNFAFIPWTIPPVIRYKLHSGAFKSFTFRDRRDQHSDGRASPLPP